MKIIDPRAQFLEIEPDASERRAERLRKSEEVPTNLSYWYPKIAATTLLTPKTEIIRTDLDLIYLCEEEAPPDCVDFSMERFESFLAELRKAIGRIGEPCFLRTGFGSGKHEWEDTCFLQSKDSLNKQVREIVYWSNLVDFFGLPTQTWVVREFLPLRIAMRLPAYGNMPLAREFRLFIDKGEVTCVHPYWPEHAVEAGGPVETDWRERLAEHHALSNKEKATLMELGKTVGTVMDGAWSVDFAQHVDGRWFLIDMAEAAKSYHYENCPINSE